MNKVFKALADPTRRRLLDALRAHSGQTLRELCKNLDMSRQAVTQHLGRLEDANLVATIRRGREKLHYLNPVPIHEIYERWIEKYERRHLNVLSDLKKKAEGDSICRLHSGAGSWSYTRFGRRAETSSKQTAA